MSRIRPWTHEMVIAMTWVIGWTGACLPGSAHSAGQRNVIIFVADGLRNGSVNSTDAPTLLSVRERGVNFTNSHSLYPTLTTPNAAAIATGHYLGDTGDFGNTEYSGFPIFAGGNFGKSPGTPVPFLENDPILGDLDGHARQANYLNEETLLALARRHGFNTAAIGKIGPAAIQDVSQLVPKGGRFEVPQTVILDDATGSPDGVPLPAQIQAAIAAAGLSATPTTRVQPAGNLSTPGTLSANVPQQRWFADATTKAVLPTFAHNGHPFVLVYWSRDPDGSQHNQGDSLNKLRPGINGPTSRAGVANADNNLRQILDYLDSDPALRATTDVFVTSDHGFATISRHEIDAAGTATKSYSTTFTYVDPGRETRCRPRLAAARVPGGRSGACVESAALRSRHPRIHRRAATLRAGQSCRTWLVLRSAAPGERQRADRRNRQITAADRRAGHRGRQRRFRSDLCCGREDERPGSGSHPRGPPCHYGR